MGGTLNGAGTFVSSPAPNWTAPRTPVTSASTLQIPNNSNLYIDGTINNTGTIELLSGGNNTEL